MFDDDEIAYLRSGGMSRLARVATVDTDGQPTVDVVGFTYDEGVFLVGHHGDDITSTRKGRNVRDGSDKVSLVVDDLAGVDPWRPRGIRVHGVATLQRREGHFGPGTYLVVTPRLTWSWGLTGSVFEQGTKRTDWR